MQLADLPSRRSEMWKWSDLRAAMAGEDAVLTGARAMPAAGPIAAFADLLGDAFGPSELIIDKVQTFENRQSDGDPGQYGRIVVKAGVEATLIERISVTGSGLRPMLASYSEIEVEPGASLVRVVVQENAGAAEQTGAGIVLNEVAVKLDKGATYRQFVLGEGAKFARIETTITTQGDSATVQLSGVYLAAGKRHIDLTSRISHGAAGGLTRQLVRGVARKGGRGVFQGKFLVERSAQKTDAEMRHNALLLEEGAEVFAKPELEIYADDVQCAHGNTAGQLNEDAIFYLRQRGIPEPEARAMITRAFLIEALPDWLDEELRGEVGTRIDTWLGGAA
jgi:Fe-S cluster assembly protein SufD